MYTVVSWCRDGKVIRSGVTLCEAYRLIRTLGRGAIFRSPTPGKYARPIYPHPRRAA